MARALMQEDFLALGLETLGFNRWRFLDHGSNIERFKDAFGAHPLTCSELWEDLRNLGKINKRSKPLFLLLVLRFLFKYDTETSICSFIGIHSEYHVRTKIKEWVLLLSSLLPTKMPSWEDADDGFIFFMSVDGTHCPIEEPSPFSTIWSSHKEGGKAALNYEVGLSISREKLIWLYGPTPPGALNDLDVARSNLFPKLREFGRGKRIIADGIYGAEEDSDLVSTKNPFDPREVDKLKDRASARHEAYNNKLKRWNVLAHRFRHSDLTFHRQCFEAVNVVCCVQMDNHTSTLFDAFP
jgi:hypothetical protein